MYARHMARRAAAVLVMCASHNTRTTGLLFTPLYNGQLKEEVWV